MMKIAVIGGGSSYTPELIDGFIKRREHLKIDEIYLVDIPVGQEKLEIVGHLVKRMMNKYNMTTQIHLTLDRKQAIQNSDFIITQLRVGGLESRAKDEKIPLKYDLIGQETTGAGGFAKALRTIPVMLDICEDIEKFAKKDAWLINFTNPAGIITETILKHTSVNAIGLCNVPIAMKKDMAEIIGAKSEDVRIDFMGLNHLVYGKKVYHKGQDVTELVVQKIIDGASNSMNNIPDLGWDPALMASLNMILCPYHRYFYMTKEMLLEEQSKKETRAVEVMGIEKELFKIYQDHNLDEKPKVLEERGGAYYSEVAVSLIDAIVNDKHKIHTVNIMNNGSISNLPDDCVVEVNALMTKNGPKPIVLGDLPLEVLGLVQRIKNYEQLTIKAGVYGDKKAAVQALFNNPLVNDFEKSKRLLEDIIECNLAYLPQFNKEKS